MASMPRMAGTARPAAALSLLSASELPVGAAPLEVASTAEAAEAGASVVSALGASVFWESEGLEGEAVAALWAAEAAEQ